MILKQPFFKRSLLGIALCVLLWGCSSDIPNEIQDKPNVLLITMDTTRISFGCYGKDDMQTPNVDRMAAEGVQFMRHISPTGTTNPAHSSIMTGYYLARHNVYNNNTPLSDEAETLAEILQAQGYSTLGAVSARWLNPDHSNFGQGFDKFLTCDREQLRAGQRNRDLFPALAKYKDKRFFAWVHYFDPHGPYVPPKPFDSMYSAADQYEPLAPSKRMNLAEKYRKQKLYDPDEVNADYKGEVSYMDSKIGKLLDQLKEMNVLDNTLVILVADHGESLGENNIYFSHAGMYNSVIHIPFIMRLPDRLPKGLKINSLTSSVDILPTILDLLDFDVPLQDIDGRSLVPAFSDPNFKPHPYIFTEAVKGVIRGIYDGEYKYIKPYPWDWAVTEDHLFKPFEDYAEQHDLKEKEPEKAAELETLLDSWLEEAKKKALGSKQATDIDPETEKALRALGYMD